MPTYQYACTECGHQFEQVQSFSDSALTQCPVCEGRLRKVYNAVGVVFKGSGFYRNDSRSTGESAGSQESGSKESGSKESGSKESGSGKESGTKDSGSGKGSGSTDSGSPTSAGSSSGSAPASTGSSSSTSSGS